MDLFHSLLVCDAGIALVPQHHAGHNFVRGVLEKSKAVKCHALFYNMLLLSFSFLMTTK